MKRPNLKIRKRERGFTLIELLIVIAILGVLAAVVVPNVMGLFGRGGSQAFGSDLQTIQTSVATFYGDVHQGVDQNGAGLADNTWADTDGDTGHWFPTANATTSDVTEATGVSAPDGDALLLYVDADGDATYDAGEEAAAADIDAAAIWMGLLVNPAASGTVAGSTDRSTAAPLSDEESMYLTEFPRSCSYSSVAGVGNGNPNQPGGTYTWIVGKNGKVYGAYLHSNGNWYSGFSGNYP